MSSICLCVRMGDEINDPEYQSHELAVQPQSDAERIRRSQRLEERKHRNDSQHLTRSITSNLGFSFDPDHGHFTDGNNSSFIMQNRRKRRRRRRRQRDPDAPPRKRRTRRSKQKRQKIIDSEEEYEAKSNYDESDFEDEEDQSIYSKSAPYQIKTRNSLSKINLVESSIIQIDDELDFNNTSDRVLRSRKVINEVQTEKLNSVEKRITRGSSSLTKKDYWISKHFKLLV